MEGERWEWGDAVSRMHGYPPGSVVPTTQLVLSHKHPDDYAEVAHLIERMNEGYPFSSKHRIVDTAGEVHHVVVVGDCTHDWNNDVTGSAGFYVDITDWHDNEVRESVDEVVTELTKSRAAIEQAKGALMLVYGISAPRAFDILVWRSQETNVRLRTVAENFVSGLQRCAPGDELRLQVDHLLLTAHDLTGHPLEHSHNE